VRPGLPVYRSYLRADSWLLLFLRLSSCPLTRALRQHGCANDWDRQQLWRASHSLPHPTGYGIYSIARLGHYEDEVAEPEEYTKRQAPGEDRLAVLSHWGKASEVARAAGIHTSQLFRGASSYVSGPKFRRRLIRSPRRALVPHGTNQRRNLICSIQPRCGECITNRAKPLEGRTFVIF
jgi:hypothetical protein